MKEDTPYHTYQWICNGTTNVQTRVGLSVDKNANGMVKNQCVFLRTVNAQFSEKHWREIQRSAVHIGHDSESMGTATGSPGLGNLTVSLNLVICHLTHLIIQSIRLTTHRRC